MRCFGWRYNTLIIRALHIMPKNQHLYKLKNFVRCLQSSLTLVLEEIYSISVLERLWVLLLCIESFIRCDLTLAPAVLAANHARWDSTRARRKFGTCQTRPSMHTQFYPFKKTVFSIRRPNLRLLAIDLHLVLDAYTNSGWHHRSTARSAITQR